MSSDVHIFNLRYSSASKPDSLRSSITKNLIKFFGNSTFLPENNDDVEEEIKHEKEGIHIYHNVFRSNESDKNARKTALNKKFFCILDENGCVGRVHYLAEEHLLKLKKNVSLNNSSFASDSQQGTSSNFTDTTLGETDVSFQVASDESYARNLQRRLMTAAAGNVENPLAGRRSMLNRSPIQITNSDGRGQYHSVLRAQRDFLSSQSLNRLSPIRFSRYVPYHRDYRQTQRYMQRHIQIHPLVTYRPSRPIIYDNMEEETPSMNVIADEDSSTAISMDGITVVAPASSETLDTLFPMLPSVPQITVAPVPVSPPTDEDTRSSPEENPTGSSATEITIERTLMPSSVHMPVCPDDLLSDAAGNSGAEVMTLYESPAISADNLENNVPIMSQCSKETNELIKTIEDAARNHPKSKAKQTPSDTKEITATTSRPDIEMASLEKIHNESDSTKGFRTIGSSSHSSSTSNNTTNLLGSMSKDNDKPNPSITEQVEYPELDGTTFQCVAAMMSSFLLIDSKQELWIWFNEEKCPTKYDADWNQEGHIKLLGCSLFRATIYLKGCTFVTFYDSSFRDVSGTSIIVLAGIPADANGNIEPSLIETLSHGPVNFGEFADEEVIDIQCSTFYTVAQTKSCKGYWWGLAPSTERNNKEHSKKVKLKKYQDIAVGDLVSLSKQTKCEMGALVFNVYTQSLGTVISQLSADTSATSIGGAQKIIVCKLGSEEKLNEVWECKNVVYIHEQKSFIGKVISLDGPYAIVNDENAVNELEKLKVYFKSCLEKVKIGDSGYQFETNRYQKYIYAKPRSVLSNKDFVVSAMSASEYGLTLLVNRLSDNKSFLMHPSSVNNSTANWFTSTKSQISKDDNLKSDFTKTVEFEAVHSEEANLQMQVKEIPENVNSHASLLNHPIPNNILHESSDEKLLETVESLEEFASKCSQQEFSTPKFSRSFSMPSGGFGRSKRKFQQGQDTEKIVNGDNVNKIRKPSLINVSVGQDQLTLMFDNIGCFYPLQFNSCLLNPPLFEILPFHSFNIIDHGTDFRDDRIITVVVVSKSSPLISALRCGDKAKYNAVLESMTNTGSKKRKVTFSPESCKDGVVTNISYLSEKCNGNQNVMHIAAANILKINYTNLLHTNIMDLRNYEENYMLQKLLENNLFWPKVKHLLCERDSHGCTPFMSAIMAQNIRGAYIMLEAIKRDGKNNIKVTTPSNQQLFYKALCVPTFNGLTPLQALIHSSSKKSYSQRWFNTLHITNLPPSYSSRLLLKLFKSRYPSVYRAVLGIPKKEFYERNIRSNPKGEQPQNSKDELLSSGSKRKTKSKIFNPNSHSGTQGERNDSRWNPVTNPLNLNRRGYVNRACIYRATAKEGLVMFGNLDELHQARNEMNNHVLLTRADHPSGALLSVVQHMVQVQQYQDADMEQKECNSAGKDPLYMKLVMTPGQQPSTSTSSSQDSSNGVQKEGTVFKCFDAIMVHLLISSLLNAEPSMALYGNSEGMSALSYYIHTYPRFSPSHLHKLFLNWRPCKSSSCKYNRHTGNIPITCEKRELQPIKDEDNKDKPEKKSQFLELPKLSSLDNPILTRRGLQNRSSSLKLNVPQANVVNEVLPSPITPCIKIDNIRFSALEAAANSGLTPQVMQPSTAVHMDADGSQESPPNFSPFFPVPIVNTKQNATSSKQEIKPKLAGEDCICPRNKARLLWKTSFEASHFLLAKNWGCIVSSVLCFFDNINGNLQVVESSKLDSFVENLFAHPYNILLEVFVKTLMQKLQDCSVTKNSMLFRKVIHENPINQDFYHGKMINSLLPWFTVHRFVRSLVRQLSLFINKNAQQDSNLKYKIGRYASKNHVLKETRMREHLILCLKAFSWLSVIEILRAADIMLKPILSGTVKAQAKGIIPFIHSAVQQQYGRLHAGGLPQGSRMHIPLSGLNSSQRTSTIRNATRLSSQDSNATVPSTVYLLEDNESENHSSNDTNEDSSSDSDDNNTLDDAFDLNAADLSNIFEQQNENTELNEIDWNQTQGGAADLAWAVDGHIRLRSETSARGIPAPFLLHQQNHVQQQILNTPSVHAGYLYLARMFCRLVKEAVDLARKLKGEEDDTESSPFSIEPIQFSTEVKVALMEEADQLLARNWQWMRQILDSLEKQLKVGEKFDTKHFVARLKKNDNENELGASLTRPSLTQVYGSTPDEYMMYLLKDHIGEAEDMLPVLDLFSYTHITYILDAYLYVKKSKSFSFDESTSSKKKRSSSVNISFFKHDIFASEIYTEDAIEAFRRTVKEKRDIAENVSIWLDESTLKKKRKADEEIAGLEDAFQWSRVIEAFSVLFSSDGPGLERDSFLAEKAGAAGRVSRFQRSLVNIRGLKTDNSPSYYPNMPSETATLHLNIVRSKLLEDCINIFTENLDNHPFGNLRVRFEGEEGTGPGVNRGLFAAFASSLKHEEKYKNWPVGFFEQGSEEQRGVYSPKVGKYDCVDPPGVYFGYPMTKEKRYSAFVAIGRFFGITLWFNQTAPFILSRPTLLYMLGREEQLSFDDLAYHDSCIYDSLSSMIIDAFSGKYTDQEFMDLYCFRFEISINNHTEELCPGGTQKNVTKENVLDYVRLYTRYLVYVCRENELQGLRDGLLQMIPKDILDNIEPEDLQLLLSGGAEDVPYTRLRSIIHFINSRGCPREVLERYKSWFWKIVKRMTSRERQKLLYFSTGSSVLPALDNRVGNNEELSITVDIISSTNNIALPMSSTCGQRISIPLYPSKSMLKQKLLQAIECKSYGLG